MAETALNKTPSEYKKSFEDELDWNLLDQLHKVVLQISSFCFRTKQICFVAEVAVIGLLAKFTKETLNDSMFVAGFLIPLCFWFLDGIAYHYQVKIRGIMDGIQDRLIRRNTNRLVHFDSRLVIEKERVTGSQRRRVFNSFFNHSMWFYYILVLTDIALWLAFCKGVIG